MVYCDDIDTVLLKWESYTASATSDFEGPPTNVIHRLLQVRVPIIERSEVPPRVIADLNIAVIPLSDFTEVVWQKTAVLAVYLLAECVDFQGVSLGGV